MKRQIIAVLTFGAFVAFSVSCYSLQEIKPDVLVSAQVKDKDILRIKKTSGETIVFSKNQPGRVIENSVQGVGAIESALSTMEIKNDQLKTVNRKGEKIVSVTMQDGRTIPVEKTEVKTETVEMWILKYFQPLKYEPISINISEVERAFAIMPDTGASLAAISIISVVVIGTIFLIANMDFDLGMAMDFGMARTSKAIRCP
jgi:hypothetical protein